MSTIAEPATGAWINHENKQWILTLDARSAGILSAALVLFVAPVSLQAWSIARFLLHQFYAGNAEIDGFHQTKQTMLRNSFSPTQISWLSIRIVWTWRKALGYRPAISRIIPILTTSLISMISWALVGLFVSSIWTATGNQVRIRSKACGPVNLNTSDVSLARSMALYWTDRLQSASTYERQCYGTSTPTGLCTRLPAARIPWMMNDSSCPYPPGEDLCIRTNSTPMRLDTGFVNSNRHLGMNAAPVDSIDYRRVTECSPMQANYISVSEKDGKFSYHYGVNVNSVSNKTYNYSLNAITLVREYTLLSVPSYPSFVDFLTSSNSALSYDPSMKHPLWQPNATIFNRTDAEMSIMFLAANGVQHYERVLDPWFLADDSFEMPATVRMSNGVQSQLRKATRPITIVGCIERHQICTPSEVGNQRCTDSSSFTGTNSQVDSIGLTPRQRATATRILFNVLGIDMAFVATWLQGDALLASRTVLEGRQNEHLPHTQWRSEVSRWFSIALILLQEGVVQYVTGVTRPEWEQFVSHSTNPDELGECTTQRVRMDSSQQNFSITGMIVVLSLGSMIIALGLSIDTIAAWLQKRLQSGERHREAWLLDGIFQHQRLAYQGLGVLNWENVKNEIPVSTQTKFPTRTISVVGRASH